MASRSVIVDPEHLLRLIQIVAVLEQEGEPVAHAPPGLLVAMMRRRMASRSGA